MQIDYLKEIVALSDTLNFSTAAKQCSVSQSSLSKHVSAVEAELGVRLFNRSNGRVCLTKEGVVFRKDAICIVNRYDSAIEKLKAMHEKNKHVITIGYLKDVASFLLSPIRTWFTRRYPEIELRFVSLDYHGARKALKNKRVDFIITMDIDSDFREKCEVFHIMPEHFVLACSVWHPLANREEVSLDDIKGEHIYMPDADTHPIRRLLNREFYDNAALCDTEELRDSDTMFALIESGEKGVAIVASHNHLTHGGLLRFIPISVEYSEPPFWLSLMWMKQNDVDFHIEDKFIVYLTRCITQTMGSFDNKGESR